MGTSFGGGIVPLHFSGLEALFFPLSVCLCLCLSLSRYLSVSLSLSLKNEVEGKIRGKRNALEFCLILRFAGCSFAQQR